MTASSTSKRSGVMRYSPSLRNFLKISSGGISGSLAACVFFAGLLSDLTSGILLLRLSLNTKQREFLFHELFVIRTPYLRVASGMKAKRRFAFIDERLTKWMADHSILFLRIAVGIIFFWFGVLKFFPNMSPAET